MEQEVELKKALNKISDNRKCKVTNTAKDGRMVYLGLDLSMTDDVTILRDLRILRTIRILPTL